MNLDNVTIPVRVTYLATHVLIELNPASSRGATWAVPLPGEAWKD